MAENTNSGLNGKFSMAKGFLESAQLLERSLDHVVAGSQEEAEAKKADSIYGKKMTAHFLYSVIFELCIKIIWEIEHNTTPKPNHDILSRYRELSKKTRQKIAEIYDIQVRNTKGIISEIEANNDDFESQSIKLQSLEEALTSNQKTIINFKYDGKFGGKSSAFCSIMWSDNETLLVPTPKLIVFPDFLLKYAISLNDI